MPASEKDPEGWGSTDKFMFVLETAGQNATELSAYCRERGLHLEQVERWRQASQEANDKPVLTVKEQKNSSGSAPRISEKSNCSSSSSDVRRRLWRRRLRC